MLIILMTLATACGDLPGEVERVPFDCSGNVCTVEDVGGGTAATVGKWVCQHDVKATFTSAGREGLTAWSRDGFIFQDLESVTIERAQEADGSLCPVAPLLEVQR